MSRMNALAENISRYGHRLQLGAEGGDGIGIKRAVALVGFGLSLEPRELQHLVGLGSEPCKTVGLTAGCCAWNASRSGRRIRDAGNAADERLELRLANKTKGGHGGIHWGDAGSRFFSA
jgi:hypothetical protein